MGMSLDEKLELQEKKKLEKEEKKQQIEREQYEKKVEEQREKERQAEEQKKRDKERRVVKPPAISDTNKYIIIGVVCVVLFLTIYLVKEPVKQFFNARVYGEVITDAVEIPNVTGMNEDDAVKFLRELGFVNIHKKYIYDQYTADKTVVKTNLKIGVETNDFEQNVYVYICDESLKNSGYEYDEIDTVQYNFASLKGIKILSSSMKDNKFYIVIKNTNNYAIENILYTVSYINEDEETVGCRVYTNLYEDKVRILPKQKYVIVGEIKNIDTYAMSIINFDYKVLPVPENQRE